MSGRLRSSLVIGGQGIRARKLRTFLSMISLFLGVLAVVVVQAGSEIANQLMLADVEKSSGKDGTRVLYLPPGEDFVPIALDLLSGRTDAAAMTTVTAIVGEPGVKAINDGGGPIDQPAYGRGGGMYCDETGCHPVTDGTAGMPSGQAIELELKGLSGDIRPFRPLHPTQGKWLEFGTEPSLSPGLVLNLEAAKAFSRYQVPARLRITGATTDATPRIVGVVDDGGYTPAAYVRIDELLNWMPPNAVGGSRGGPGVEVMFTPTAGETERLLTSRLAAAGAPAEQLSVRTVDVLERMKSQLALMRWIFLGMASLVLLIGVAGILNVGLATVGERIEEFALRRAVGTSRMLLAGIVLAETMITGLLTAGAAIGVSAAALPVAVGLVADKYPALSDMPFPWQAAVAGIVAGVAAGVLGGLIPALRAARIPIATVMRA
ncbi:hypothetical protein GCM10022243_54850 [Saccharothrix violaceirubra]|uniref:Putative ABC transport system permease protein n=1 Tax=Saccharothrix violaceirubra TaxID=413306 RepID=A0A7W7T5K5_9PSEU|nr:FtsX-like permease family protein [Saccharothrix violaceirubra]MBB4966998.1 putative ABC transport system permease protein [Saccharothrix violaceirubra]